MLRLGTTLAECVLTHILADFGTQKGSIWRRGLQGVIAKRKLRNRWIQFPHLQMKNWRSGREAQIYCSRIHTPGSKWLTLIFWCWWLLREMKPAIFFFPPWRALFTVVLSYCLHFSPASILFSAISGPCSFLIRLLNQGRFSCLCFNVQFVFSFLQDISQSLVTLQNDPFLTCFNVCSRPHFPCDLDLLYHSILFSLCLL